MKVTTLTSNILLLFHLKLTIAFGPQTPPTSASIKSFNVQVYKTTDHSSATTARTARATRPATLLHSKAPPGGIDFEIDETSDANRQQLSSSSSPTSNGITPTSGIINSNADPTTAAASGSQSGSSTASTTQQQPLPFQNRGKVNEIDFCMSPSDVSLSRSSTTTETGSSPTQQPRILSLTRALNNASNRAVRRILLSRCWPSAEALNISLRQVLASKKETDNDATDGVNNEKSDDLNLPSDTTATTTATTKRENEAKCPVPRPILNIMMQNKDNSSTEIETRPITEPNMSASSSTPSPLQKMKLTDEQWVDEQMKAFRETYGLLPGYEYADAYMECILSLATSGVESERVSDVMAGGVYDDSYRRLIAVLRTAGAVFEGQIDAENGSKESRMKIARKLKDKDICLSMLDKISIRNGKPVNISDSTINDSKDSKTLEPNKVEKEVPVDEKPVPKEVTAKGNEISITNKAEKAEKKTFKNRFLFFMKRVEEEVEEVEVVKDIVDAAQSEEEEEPQEAQTQQIKPEDLGAVLLSAEEPTMTRQLNALSNVVKRALLFGGDQELLVLAETLEADKPAFTQRWYPDSNGAFDSNDLKNETRPGVQFFNCLVQLLKDSYTYGVVTDLDPPFPLSPTYENSYERLTAVLVELGSGYIKPINTKKKSNLPKTPKEELIRFSQWEVALRQTKPDVSDYPSDLVGTWQVKDEIGGKMIGTSTVVFKSEGEVSVNPPLRGLRWRLDPGPTHLDTCTFQVLNEDGAVIQYRGFLDRGARLESRFSKRSIKIRGAVTFQMRDGDTALLGEDYKKDMLPIDTMTGTTRFVMSKVFDLNDD